MDQRKVILKPGKDKAIRHRHHWIFSGAVQSLPDFQNGEILSVYNSKQEFLGQAYFNRHSGIVGRMISFDQNNPLETLKRHLDEAISLRKHLFDPRETNAFRLVNGEGDRIPGLIVDCYDDTLVFQIGSSGMEKLKPWLIRYWREHWKTKVIYEKSTLPSRKEEGLSAQTQGILFGVEPEEIFFKENGLSFSASLAKSQKTGFFLDQREMRKKVKALAAGRKVLNAFSYTGGFTVYALAGGAVQVDSLDISQEALEWAKKNVQHNKFEAKNSSFICSDVFQFLREQLTLDYQLVILDPPAFAKKRDDVVAACRGYKDINRLTLQKMPPHSFLVTCSCSQHVDTALFQQVIFQASVEAKREVRIVGRHELAPDHPINIYHPESDYLKSLILYVV